MNIPCHSLLVSKVSAEKSADSLKEIPLHVMCFSLVAFNILPLSLFFIMLTTMCLGGFCFCFFVKVIQFRLCASSKVKEVSSYYIFKYFLSLLFVGLIK